MYIKEDRHTSTAVSFNVDINSIQSAPPQGHHHKHEEPEIKKRLEAYSQQHITSGTESREAIAEKLKRAEEKRNLALSTRGGNVSPRQMEERRRAARERKRIIDQDRLSHNKERCEGAITMAEEKRKQSQEERRLKLRQHFAKVEEVRKEQASRRQSSAEKLKSEIQKKIEVATHKREENLENVKNIAHHSAEKKNKGNMGAAGYAPSPYDEKPLPTHSKINFKKD